VPATETRKSTGQHGRQRRADRLGELHPYASSTLGPLRQPSKIPPPPETAVRTTTTNAPFALFLCITLYAHAHHCIAKTRHRFPSDTLHHEETHLFSDDSRASRSSRIALRPVAVATYEYHRCTTRNHNTTSEHTRPSDARHCTYTFVSIVVTRQQSNKTWTQTS